LLLLSGIHPNPGPSPQSLPLPVILQFNCNGIKNSVSEIDDFLRSERVSVAALQETFLSDYSLPFPDYTLVRKDRGRGHGGGVVFLIHQSVTYSPVDTSFLKDNHTECLAVRVVINGSDLVIFNIYLPPASSPANSLT
jgi:exonuclease III